MEDAPRVFLQNLELIEGIIRHTCARQGFRGDNADEFASRVRIKFLEEDYAVLRKFRGECQLRTYLITVIQRLAIDFRIAQAGKWRSSRAAERLGPLAVELEKLVSRERHSTEECVQIVLHRHPDLDRKEVESVFAQLPSRRETGKPVVVEWQDQSHDLPDVPVEQTEQWKLAVKIESVVREFVKGLPEEDRLLLGFRYDKELPVPEIARMLGSSPKRLYRRLDRLMERFRRVFQEQQIEVPSRLEEASKWIRLFDDEKGAGEKRPGVRLIHKEEE